MSTHLLALIVAVTLTEWLLLAGWMREDSQYYLWAAVVIVAWWIGNRRSNPAWPSSRDQHIRILIFGGYFGVTALFALMIKSLPVFLVAVLIPALFLFELMQKSR
jgi:hypothetical protein